METAPNDAELKDIRIPPYSKEAENGVLGSLLVDNGTMDMISTRIRADDFYDYGNRLIYQAIYDLISSGRPADVITVLDEFNEKFQKIKTGGFEYLNRMDDFNPGTANIIRYA
ncbi:MAG: hypothetical protein LUC43_00795 [Burkholderiales bacterium]|nr:hypothetical protein [Burkholderiales bacterium]